MRMQRWLAIAILGSAMTLPGLAQHASGGHGGGGFSGGGHSLGGFSSAPSHVSSGLSGGSSHTYGSVQGRVMPRSIPRYGSAAPIHTGLRAGSQYGHTNSGANSPTHSGISAHSASMHANSTHNNSGNRGGNWGRQRGVRLYSPRVSALGWWLGPWQFYPWLDGDLSWDYWHDTGDDDTAIAMASTGADMVEDAPPQSGGFDQDAADDDLPLHGTATQLESTAPALTLVYRSGQTEQVANYVMSKDGVTVVDASGVRSVPVADLDVHGTISANAQSGMQMPSSWR